MFHDGPIEGIIVRELKAYHDARGWLLEIFRSDELPAEFLPAMAYVSETRPGVARGPHEHVQQADLFAFLGPSNFKVFLWDNRPASPTFHNRKCHVLGEDRPATIIIPQGVVHAYLNVGDKPGWVVNCPNRLYKGAGRKEPIDEIRHEDRSDNLFHFF